MHNRRFLTYFQLSQVRLLVHRQPSVGRRPPGRGRVRHRLDGELGAHQQPPDSGNYEVQI